MGEKCDKLSQKHIDFIAKQKVFFTATADENSKINLSPKGLDSFRIIDNNLAIFLNKTGSGNETAAHLQHSPNNPRMTIMFCSFEGDPMILRLYGKAIEIKEDNENFKSLLSNFDDNIGARQIFALDIDLVQTSCGFGVPLFDYKGDRDTLNKWAENKGKQGIKDYQNTKNTTSLDGKKIVI
jgi:hypothetical protein